MVTVMTRTTLADPVSFKNMSDAEWPSIKWPIQVVEIIYPDRLEVRAEGLVKSCNLTSKVLIGDSHSQI